MKEKDFIRIMAVSPETFPGDMSKCYDRIIAAIDTAVSYKASLLLFPELCITSSSCGDLFSYEYISEAAENNLMNLIKYTKDKCIMCCFSFPMIRDPKVYDVAALTFDGRILGIVPLPVNKSIATNSFSEYQSENTLVEFGGQEVSFGHGLIFSIGEFHDLAVCIGKTPEKNKKADVYLVPDALLAGVGRQKRVEDWCCKASRDNSNTVVYSSVGEGETNTCGVFSGQTVIAHNGELLASSSFFESGYSIADIKLDTIIPNIKKEKTITVNACLESKHLEYQSVLEETPATASDPLPFLGDRSFLTARCEEIFEIQSRSLTGRLKKTGISKTVIGVSGGLDSTLALLVSVKAMELLKKDRSHVIAVSMPCFGTSNRTKTNAQKLCEELGVDFRVIDISDSVRQHLVDIGHDEVTADTTYENAQARERTQVLMDLSNMEDGLVVGTGDLSEAALGWCTFNGDHMSMYNVNCSVPKTLIRAIVTHYAEQSNNRTIKDVLMDIVDTPVSPELKPASGGEISQKTEEIVGPYDVHDFFLYHFIRYGRSMKMILDLSVDAFRGRFTTEQLGGWLKLFIRRFVQSQFKRSCVPDGPTIGIVDIYPNKWRIPSDYSAADYLR